MKPSTLPLALLAISTSLVAAIPPAANNLHNAISQVEQEENLAQVEYFDGRQTVGFYIEMLPTSANREVTRLGAQEIVESDIRAAEVVGAPDGTVCTFHRGDPTLEDAPPVASVRFSVGKPFESGPAEEVVEGVTFIACSYDDYAIEELSLGSPSQ